MIEKNNDKKWIGKKFNRLTVIGFEHYKSETRKRSSCWKWVCKCDCGIVKTLYASYVKSGYVKSCGCLLRETSSKRMTKHKYKIKDYKRLYGIYNGIKRRCLRKTDRRYKDYGGRGIKMCDEWLNLNCGFDRFVEWSLANGYVEGLTIERENVNGDYSPDNCKSSIRKVKISSDKNRNRLSSSRFLVILVPFS